ncbi:transcriptional regulator [Pasteurellaceae bacterium RH1A]|nr:transcriptional regulator [Pasteurellaceae bacterium RH1A]
MKALNEKNQFSERLKFALKLHYPKGYKTSQIAIKFNLQHPNEPVTQQAVHKWLNGLAIPSNDKIETLAKWLNVTTLWLRYGEEEEEVDEEENLTEILNTLIGGLSEEQKRLLVSLIMQFK